MVRLAVAFVAGLLACWVLLLTDVRSLGDRLPVGPSDMPADMPGMQH